MTDWVHLQCNFVVFILKTFTRIIHITDFLPSRELLIDIQLPDGKIMPAGTTYCIDLASLQLNKCVWGEDVLEFNPDRFETTLTVRHPWKPYFKNIPFSAGRRNCIGQGFAIQEMKIMMLRVCSRLQVENEIIEKDADCDRPILKQEFLWKMKSNSLKQRFSYL